MNFALGWTILAEVFGQIREIPGHDSYLSKGEMHENAGLLKAIPEVQQITYYQRVNGEMKAIDNWHRFEVSA